ncbi:peptidylprolyl isomerase [Siphonobacter sp. SORGH_AS_0500]|uniref:peptidylprolyl isomerase n=1 Tax=Siphonobacter sp. SORGH_AS_0500 TaxID=1864824 RepID=UPI002864DBB0|nr:peptidylprolyl isomerase [Siphonobacter sp. SORGH_AS_0500]MDR6196376.1 cyclophilin family peptidyl-prolyl cis-trans isomerase [Siphonobacter sp. SORGH_AS_0500]
MRKSSSMMGLGLALLLALPSFAQRKEKLVTIETKYGPIRLILFDQTPKHKANFLKLTKEHFYDGILFHRVIPTFMIQGGDPESKKATPDAILGSGDMDYTIPAEFVPELFHQRGAVGAAREDNPAKASSGCHFYIVQGKTYDEVTLETQAKRAGRPLTDAQKEVYKTKGGTPRLDGNYTVFGQVIDGMAAVDSIAAQPRNEADRPNVDISMMKVTAKKMSKKKITRRYGYVFAH